LAVRRPEEVGESFGGMWGLPAATVGEGETPEAAVRRLGSQKLGMTLEIARGKQDRAEGELSMVLFEARAAEAEPKLGQGGEADGVTYYTDWKWAEAAVFEATAAAGSLCCRLYLEWVVDSG
jgi:ADP-ribose pyrophosphatase YjhB (NUDIX family)